MRLFPGWGGDIQPHWFNEFDINDLIAAHKAGDLVEYIAITKVHNLYAAITTQQHKAKFNEVPLLKELIDGEKTVASSKGKKTRQKRFRLVD